MKLNSIVTSALSTPGTILTSTVFTTITSTVTTGSASTAYKFVPGNPPSSTPSPTSAAVLRQGERSASTPADVTIASTVTEVTTIKALATTSTLYPCASPFPSLTPTLPYGDASLPSNFSTQNSLFALTSTREGASAQACCSACFFELANCIQAYWYSYEGCVVSLAINASLAGSASGKHVSRNCPAGIFNGLSYERDMNPAFRSTGNIAGPCVLYGQLRVEVSKWADLDIINMSLNTVTKGVGNTTGSLNKTVDSTKKGDVSSTVKQTKKQADTATKDLSGVSVPGEFPDNDRANDKKAQEMPQVSIPSFSSMLQWLMDKFESTVRNFISKYLPQQRQEAIYKSAMSRPMATTFIICQLICCGVPLLVFMAGVFIFAAVAILLWAILSLLVLGPVLLVTGCSGFLMWGWGWLFYSFIKWVDQRFLGGVLTRFFLPLSSGADDDTRRTEEEDKESGSSEKKKP
ncbi:conserved hypothetical protein [Talaromyces stipitatus ATCC 10500]|uniref:Uncharacterized protein n=1 Tax=Talaromyces stipitatus (strain ATCC 10500 / CBS 375.48 / QM 6759 / NRRL 1006) TaxID=441959 RepID=B8MB94_TALSN|nr:uncharacterized protein TSTA_125950 [Talaromyces stipitatus ATCC 10500]EED18883.1 conserved hypothetical protein [Talaromyces stipitatus ATCC 10500]